jgi:fatty-acyl-CoA synthase
VDDGRRTLSYGEFNERVNRLANVMLAHGLKPQDRIAILSRNSIEYLEVMMASAKIGVIVCCLNWRLAPVELSHCIGLVQPAMIFFQAPFHELVQSLELELPFAVVFEEEYEPLLARASRADPPLAAHGEDGLLVLFTSGTTGLPKGALISHRAYLSRALVYASELHVPAKDTFFAWSPLFHIGSADHAVATLLLGGKVFTVDGFRPDIILPALERNRTHWLSLLPGVIDRVIDAMNLARPTLAGVGIVGGMADLISPDQVAELSTLFQAPYLDSFGSTETGLPPATGALIPIGVAPEKLRKRQTGFCEVRLVDAHDQEVSDGTPGEVAIRRITLFSGYVGDAEANENSFRGGWYHMGDVMTRSPDDASLEFVDRIKYLIKSGGENIYPAELERVILRDSRVTEVAVVRQADPKWGEVPVAFVARNDSSFTEETVAEMCAEALARYKHPKAVRFIELDEFPRGSTGKVKRSLLEALL